MKYYTYDDVYKIAVKSGIKPNKVMVGIWAKMNGYTKVKREIKDNKLTSLYIYERSILNQKSRL